jgi:hypothetical protein
VKVDFGREPAVRYIEIERSKEFTITVRLDEVLPADIDPGDYAVSVWYHNQYGANCFVGRVVSNEIKIQLQKK